MAGPEQRPAADAQGIAELTEDIERTRAAMGETVSALSDKLDVKKQAQQKVADTKDKMGAVRPALPASAAAVATVTILLGIIVWRRRRSRSTS